MIYEEFEVAVIGAGHAGCEAALACARLGKRTILFTINRDSIAMMPCNPNIGGSSKGHLVREVDALGGEMGKTIDKAYLQSRMLNQSKGPAVHSLRAQADKVEYANEMKKVLEQTDKLLIRQAEVTDFIIKEERVRGVITSSQAIYQVGAIVLCTGTYLKARCLYGSVCQETGPNGLSPARQLSEALTRNGIRLQRFKTGTPARIDARTIDFSKMSEQKGEEKVVPFSFTNIGKNMEREQLSCWLTYTNENTHEIIKENINRSPLYGGIIEGTGPRYCPSIEDKVMRFKDKDKHQVFIEPEGKDTNEMYIAGMSSSMPEDVQYEMYRSVRGLENAQITRNAYAIEYDCIEPKQLKASLESKTIQGFFCAGQINGSSGYEEAAAQGIIAGINAARYLDKKKPLVLDRSQAYIGVLIDDLVTKGTNEPYRMMTSRAEYRLLLRQDNADLRLTQIGYEIGLIGEERYQSLMRKKEAIESECERLNKTIIGAKEWVNEYLESKKSARIQSGTSLAELIKRPELSYRECKGIDKERPELEEQITEQVNIRIKYEGYLKRQERQVEQFKRLERKQIPGTLDYEKIKNLRLEAKQKLKEARPTSIGQASRISGVSPADVSVLMVFMEQFNKEMIKEQEEEHEGTSKEMGD